MSSFAYHFNPKTYDNAWNKGEKCLEQKKKEKKRIREEKKKKKKRREKISPEGREKRKKLTFNIYINSYMGLFAVP